MISLNAITKELVLACRQLGLSVSESLAALVARTIFNNATSAFYAEAGGLQEPEARVVVEESVKKLFNTKQQPGMETLALQAAFETAALEGEQKVSAIAQEQAEYESRTINFIIQEGASSSVHLNYEQGNLVWNKIVEMLVKRCKVPSMPSSVSSKPIKEHNDKYLDKEMTQILESVMPKVTMQRFLALTAPEKRQQTEELLRICHGIRILNLKLAAIQATGSAAADSAPCLLLEQCWTVSKLEEVISHIQEQIEESTEMCRQWKVISLKHNAKKEELAHWRQRLVYWQTLCDDFTMLQTRLGEHRAQYDGLVQALVEKIEMQRGSLAKGEVYPLFDSLGKLLGIARLDLHLATAKLDLRELLQKSQYCPTLPKEFLETLKAESSKPAEPKPTMDEITEQITTLITEVHGPVPAILETKNTTTQSSSSTSGTDTHQQFPLVVSDHPMFLSPDTTPNFLQLPLDFQGYCVQRLCSSDGVLSSGDPGLGVIQYKGRFCVFESFEMMKEFVKSPSNAFLAVREHCYKMPQLIQLLRLHEDFPQSSLHAVLEHFGAQKVDDGSTQTPVHFLESNIDPTYEWNEWKLRKDALRMADIRRKHTHGTQTIGSTFRRENETQTYLPKDQSTSTGTEKGSATMRWKRHIGGLRGAKTEMKITNFKFEV
ncbi:unnamed protein product [Amoebophrya sp. A120]|nr:unnamed protein product [Amoebophrya sp. A120]|eukprot:GSA120T00012051001.1